MCLSTFNMPFCFLQGEFKFCKKLFRDLKSCTIIKKVVGISNFEVFRSDEQDLFCIAEKGEAEVVLKIFTLETMIPLVGFSIFKNT